MAMVPVSETAAPANNNSNNRINNKANSNRVSNSRQEPTQINRRQARSTVQGHIRTKDHSRKELRAHTLINKCNMLRERYFLRRRR